MASGANACRGKMEEVDDSARSSVAALSNQNKHVICNSQMVKRCIYSEILLRTWAASSAKLP